MVGGTVVSHASETHGMVASSPTEAECIGGVDGVKEALFVCSVLSFVAPDTHGAGIKVFEDNEGAIELIENPMSSAKTKHIDVRFYFLRDLFRRKVITCEHLPTEQQHADMLTKALPESKFVGHRNALMNLKMGLLDQGGIVSFYRCGFVSCVGPLVILGWISLQYYLSLSTVAYCCG